MAPKDTPMSDALSSLEPLPTVEEVIARRRGDRYSARRWLWRNSHNKRVTQCGRFVRSSAVAVKVTEHADGRREAGYGNLEHCGSVWGCPVCSARILQARSLMTAEVLHRADAKGWKIVLVTLTVRHNRRQPLGVLWDGVAAAWAGATSGTWTDDQLEYGPVKNEKGQGRIPWLRVFEVTHGINGWHVHVHALLLVRADVTEADARALGIRMWTRWDRRAQKVGLSAGVLRDPVTGDLVGVDAKVFAGDPSKILGDYFSKAVYELTGARFKLGQVKGQHRTPWGVLADLVTGEDGFNGHALTPSQRKRLRAIWYEYEEASQGRRLMGRSKNLLDVLDMRDWEPSDQEIVDEELGGEIVYLIGPDDWRSICRHGLDAVVLAAFETSVAGGKAMVEAISRLQAAVSPRVDDPPPPQVPDDLVLRAGRKPALKLLRVGPITAEQAADRAPAEARAARSRGLLGLV